MWVPFFLLEVLSQRIYRQCHHQRLGRVQSYREGLSNVAMGMVAVRRGKDGRQLLSLHQGKGCVPTT